MKTILLDLNYTLVGNSEQKIKPFTAQIEAEQYRQWLVELIKLHYVILITARPKLHQERTLASIKDKTGWQPQAHYFNFGMYPSQFKETVLKNGLLETLDIKNTLAIESNPKTRKMYQKYNINSIFIKDGEVWLSLPHEIT